jgi:FkbM family methyltransferase
MDKYIFKEDNQSNWIIDLYNKYIPYKEDGFLVEIGVGNTIKGIDKLLPKELVNFTRCMSNTADLLDIGWSGIYIDPVSEYCEEAKIYHKDNLDRLKIVNLGASNQKGELQLYLGDSFTPNNYGTLGYDWIGRKVEIDITSEILKRANCPKKIDIMSIDVEGYELEVIKGIDFSIHEPSIIILEIDKISISRINETLPSSYVHITNDTLNGVWLLKSLI